MFAADFEETKHLDEKKPGDLVSATVNPPGTVLTGKVTDAGGWPWMGGPKSFRATVSPGHAGKHMSSFDGTWTKGGTEPGEPLTWTMDVIFETTDLKIEIIPDDNFQGRSLTSLGLLETGSVKVSPKNPGGDIFPLKELKVVNGNDFFTLRAVNLANGTAKFTAGDMQGRATILATSKNGKSLTYDVIAITPSGAVMIQKPGTNVYHQNQSASVGIKALVFLLPKNVSFNNIFFREGEGTAKGIGWYKDNGKDGEKHTPTPEPLTIGKGNIQTGCQVNAVDTMQGSPYVGPYSNGTFTWPIDFEYNSGNDWEKFFTAIQIEVIEPSGRLSIKKIDLGFYSKEFNDPDQDYE